MRLLEGKELEVPGKKKGQSRRRNKYEILTQTEIRVDTPRDAERSEAIRIEKAIIRYRLYLLKTFAISKIKELRVMANSIYSKLDDWIIFGIKAQNDAVYELVNPRKKFSNILDKIY